MCGVNKPLAEEKAVSEAPVSSAPEEREDLIAPVSPSGKSADVSVEKSPKPIAKATLKSNEDDGMEGYFQHYRMGVLGSTLRDTLEEMEAINMIDGQCSNVLLKTFDRCMMEELAKVKEKVTIEGRIKIYRHHDDIWNIFLESMNLVIGDRMLVVKEPIQMVGVQMKKKEEPEKGKKQKK